MEYILSYPQQVRMIKPFNPFPSLTIIQLGVKVSDYNKLQLELLFILLMVLTFKRRLLHLNTSVTLQIGTILTGI